MPQKNAETPMPLCRDFSGLRDLSPLSFILDLDGTLAHGFDCLPGARELIRFLGDRFVVVSNNSTHSAPELVAALRPSGLEIPEDRVILAGAAAVRTVARDYRGARVLLSGSDSLRRLAEAAGIYLVEEAADVVLLARDLQFTYAKLKLLVNEVRRGAQLVVTNPDHWHPGENGELEPETGSLLQAVLACATPRTLRVVGKPEAPLFQEAIERLGPDAGECVVVGDNPATDGAGAQRLGMRCLLLGSGPRASIASVAELARQLSEDPDFIEHVLR